MPYDAFSQEGEAVRKSSRPAWTVQQKPITKTQNNNKNSQPNDDKGYLTLRRLTVHLCILYYVCMLVCTCVHVCVDVYACTHVCTMYVYMYVCMHVHIYSHPLNKETDAGQAI